MAKKEKSYGEILTAGFIKENPVLRLVLGTCPTLAVTTQAFNNHRWFRNNYSDAC